MAYLKRRKYYENASVQAKGVSRILQILSTFSAKEGDELAIEFFFDTDTLEKAQNLADQLNQLGYELYGIYESNGKQSISGCTHSLKITNDAMIQWSDLMNDLGFENDCKFDGWGSLIKLDSPIDPTDLNLL